MLQTPYCGLETFNVVIIISNISDEGVKSLMSAGGGRVLRSVSLRYTNITDRALVALAAACAHLAELDVKLCRLITDTGVKAVCELRGTTLQLLNLGK